MLRVAFICPFNLDRLTGTPIRAKVTIEAIQTVCEVCVLSTGGQLPQVQALTGIWQERANRPPLFRMDRFTKAVLRGLRDFKPDIIHAITTASMLPAILYKLRYPGTKLVFEMHGLASYEMRDASWFARLIFSALDQIGVKLSDSIVAMSYTQRFLLLKMSRVKASKVHVLWGPVNLNFFRYQDPPPTPPFNAGYLGNDMFWQGLNTILEAAQLLQSHENIHFLLGGFDPGSCSNLVQ